MTTNNFCYLLAYRNDVFKLQSLFKLYGYFIGYYTRCLHPHHVNHFVYSGFATPLFGRISVCRFTCHEKCMNHLIISCPYLALTKIMVNKMLYPPGISDGTLCVSAETIGAQVGKSCYNIQEILQRL